MRSVAVSSILAVALGAACSGAGNDAQRTRSPLSDSCADPFGGVEPAFRTREWKTDFCKHSVDYIELRSGGPRRDGIPPIDAPKLVSVREAGTWLADNEPVLAYEHAGQARAYPMQILIWHEIVNDTVGDKPVAVTFCPLCYAAIIFERPVVGGRELTFGTTGNLRNSDLVMWDRQTETWWQQFSGEAIVGELLGRKLEQLPGAIISWREFKEIYPQAQVLSRDTGFDRPYGRNPYAGYDDISKRPFLYDGKVDVGLAPMAHVVGVQLAGAERAYARSTLRAERVVNDTLGDAAIVVWWKPGATSALDRASIAASKDIGASGVFSRRVDDRTLRFRATSAGEFRDVETGSSWNLRGHAVAGPMTGKRLQPLAHHNVFWFVWSAFAHQGTLYEP